MTKDPCAHRVDGNGLALRVLEWAATPHRSIDARTVILVHGYMDAAGTWDRVAPLLAEEGYRVLAADMRGYGDADRAPAGSYYHFSDYVVDLAAVIEQLSPNEPVALVGHSMGGTITTLYAGAFPEKVRRLANLEGLGPPDNPFEVGPLRMRKWIDDLRTLRARAGPPPMSLEEARRRLVGNHPTVPQEVLDTRLPHLVREVAPSSFAWRSDPLHRTTSPQPFFAKLFVEFAKLVTCPVLFVSGGPQGWHPADEAERLQGFHRLQQTTLEGAGHMMHWTRPNELAAALLSFL